MLLFLRSGQEVEEVISRDQRETLRISCVLDLDLRLACHAGTRSNNSITKFSTLSLKGTCGHKLTWPERCTNLPRKYPFMGLQTYR